ELAGAAGSRNIDARAIVTEVRQLVEAADAGLLVPIACWFADCVGSAASVAVGSRGLDDVASRGHIHHALHPARYFQHANQIVESYAEPHHWEILRATSLTSGAMPLMPWPSSAAAILPPIQEPWPFQSVVSGPPNSSASSLSLVPKNVLQIGGSSVTVKSITL